MHVGIDVHPWQPARGTRQLLLDLFKVVGIYVRVAKGVDKISRTQAGDLCHHLQQQGIRCNVERHAKENVGTTLV